MGARAEREHQRQLVEAARPDDVGVGAHRRVDRVHAAVDQRIGPVAADVRDLDRLEVRRRRRRRAGDLRQREVIGRVAAGARRAEEEREPVLDVVGRDEHVGQRGRQPRVAEILRDRGVEPVVVVALVDPAVERDDLLQQAAVEDLRALLDVDVGQLFGAVERPPVGAGTGEAAGEDPTRRGAGDEVDHLRDPAAGAALDLRQHERGDQAADAAAVDAEHLHAAIRRRRIPARRRRSRRSATGRAANP